MPAEAREVETALALIIQDLGRLGRNQHAIPIPAASVATEAERIQQLVDKWVGQNHRSK